MSENINNISKVVILTGGCSSEREVSLSSAGSIAHALDELGIEHETILAEEDFIQQLQTVSPELVFIAMHGAPGEDGVIQGLLDSMGISYTGSSVFSSALCMDKDYSKKILTYHGIKTPKWKMITELSEIDFEIPFVLKPNRGGSTIGASVVMKRFEIEEAFETCQEECAKTNDAIMLEEYISGKELTVGILDGKALPVLEIESMTDFYDYQSKYKPGMSKHFVPENIPADLIAAMQRTAEEVNKLLLCSGMSRVDFRLDKENAYVLEVNTIPGMTSTSLLPEAAAAAGIDFKTLVLKILESAKKKD